MFFSSNINGCVSDIKEIALRHGIRLSKGIELFCGDGSLYTVKLAELVDELTGIDVKEEAGKKLEKKCSNVSFICDDAIQYVKRNQNQNYNIVSIDNPLCIFGNDYCEHFEVIESLRDFMAAGQKFILAFDYVTTPYNDKSPTNERWLYRRKQYYNLSTYNITSKKAMEFYETKFHNMGFKVFDMKSICREKCDDNSYFHLMICVMEKPAIKE